MKKIITRYFTWAICLLILQASYAQTGNIRFYDSGFKRLLIASGYDINNDKEISYAEAESITSLKLSSVVSHSSDLQYLINLEHLDCADAQLSSIQVSKNKQLKSLICNNNKKIGSLDLRQNQELTYLECNGNINLQDIFFPINSKLKEVKCIGNYLGNLNLFSSELTYLDCSRNSRISSIQLDRNTKLKHLNISYCSLDGIDLSKNTLLSHLNCSENKFMRHLNLENNTELTYLNCSNDSLLTELDLRHNTKLTHLECSSNQIRNLNISNSSQLSYLDCSRNKLINLNVNNKTQLKYLDFSHNPSLSNLDLSDNTQLTYLNGRSNRLNSLDLSNNQLLNTLYLIDCSIEQIDLSKNTELIDLDISGSHRISSFLNLGNNTKLEKLKCSNTDLIGMDISKCSELTELVADWNSRLKDLDLSNNTKLKRLYIPQCAKLENINLSTETELTTIDAGQMGVLKYIDLSKQKHLKYVKLGGRKLEYIDVANGNNAHIEKFEASNSSKLQCIKVDDHNASYLSNRFSKPLSAIYISRMSCSAYLGINFTEPLQATVKNNSVQLTWAMGASQASTQLVIERSLNGEIFSSITTLKSKGSNASYAYEDHPVQGTVYYRIAVISPNGEKKHSYVVSATVHHPTAVSLYPNPVTNGQLNISNAGTGFIDIISVNGQKLLSVKATGTITKINTTSLAKGYYFAVVNGKSYQFIIQ